MRLKVLFVLVVLAAWCWSNVPVAARDLHVNNVAGDDRNDGSAPTATGARSGPFRTIGRALRAARNGDQVIVAKTAVPYRESLTLQAGRHSGVAGRPFVLAGNGATLDGTEPVPIDAWENVRGDIFRFAAERKSSHVLYLAGKPARRRPIEEGAPGIPPLEALEWCLRDGHVYFRVEPGKLPWAYELSHTALPVGLTLYEVRHVVIQDLIVQGFAQDGVNAHDGVVDTELVSLTCRGNGRAGISIGGASRVRVEACLVGDNGMAQLRTEGFSHTLVVNCDLLEEPQAPAIDREGGDVSIEGQVADASAGENRPY